MNILGVCGGNGVILHPFKKHLIANIEPRSVFYTKNQEQWRANFGSIPMYKSLNFNTSLPEVEVIIGAPDCGHSSILSYSRSKKFSDPKKNQSLELFIESVNLLQPKLFLMENLPALVTTYGEDALKAAFFKYKLQFFCVSVSRFGNSQKNRVRLLLVGTLKPNNYKIKLPPEGKYELKTCGELLSQISGLSGTDTEPDDKMVTMFSRFKLPHSKISKLWRTKYKHQKRWPVLNRNFTSAPGVYKNLKNDFPATARKANRQFNHRGIMMSPRELARIQGVPDNFEIITKGTDTYWINKGRVTVTKCPPYEVGHWFYKQLKKKYKND
jgi:site-specific DNA-cytosine methylase